MAKQTASCFVWRIGKSKSVSYAQAQREARWKHEVAGHVGRVGSGQYFAAAPTGRTTCSPALGGARHHTYAVRSVGRTGTDGRDQCFPTKRQLTWPPLQPLRGWLIPLVSWLKLVRLKIASLTYAWIQILNRLKCRKWPSIISLPLSPFSPSAANRWACYRYVWD
jgi:hypothetical protein